MNQVQGKIEAIEKRVLGRMEFNKLVEFRYATSKKLLSRLRVVEHLGDLARTAGETDLAEIAYTRVLDIYRRQLPVASSIRPLLMKMASFYWIAGQPLRAERCWWEIFKLRDPTGETRYFEKDVWQRLAISLPQTSSLISHTIRSRYPDLFSPLNLETPFPPVHAMIQSEYTSDISHTKSGREFSLDTAGLSTIQSVISGDVGNLSDVIRKISNDDLAARDILCQTPLFLAALLKQEDAGHALLMRIARLPPVDQSKLIRARDVTGQTILGVATLHDCSKQFIKALIEHGAEIDPDPLAKDAPTPLQAACFTSRPEIVDLFLGHGADINRVLKENQAPYNQTPAQLAQSGGNDKIIQLIEKHHSRNSSNATQSTQHSPTDNDSTQTVCGNCPSPPHAATSDALQDDNLTWSDFLLSSFTNNVSDDLLDGFGENSIMNEDFTGTC